MSGVFVCNALSARDVSTDRRTAAVPSDMYEAHDAKALDARYRAMTGEKRSQGSAQDRQDSRRERRVTMRPNHALQRTRPSRHCCKRASSWAGSLSLGR